MGTIPTRSNQQPVFHRLDGARVTLLRHNWPMTLLRNLNGHRGGWAALSMVLGALVGAGVNLLTDSWNWTIAGAVMAALIIWAAIEWHRAATGVSANRGPTGPEIGVVQNVRRVAGKLTGVRRRADASGPVRVRQTSDYVEAGGEVTGYTDMER